MGLLPPVSPDIQRHPLSGGPFKLSHWLGSRYPPTMAPAAQVQNSVVEPPEIVSTACERCITRALHRTPISPRRAAVEADLSRPINTARTTPDFCAPPPDSLSSRTRGSTFSISTTILRPKIPFSHQTHKRHRPRCRPHPGTQSPRRTSTLSSSPARTGTPNPPPRPPTPPS